ncbi:MAG: hypothetical protein A2X36_16470 [Elusimicrobia bacterium GWA2_69_24]|nr:MAG: hypothetical protein A2X36_16470 [Elusimicrobia bacterium GWA2_69_24]HBL18432.1 hypothetical protein [Elusimicrobiota bacterium]
MKTRSAPPAELRNRVADRFAPGYYLTDLLEPRQVALAVAQALGRPEDASRLWEESRRERRLDCRGLRALWKERNSAERSSARPRPDLHLFLHIPFCRQKCAYCCYHSEPLRNPRALAEYLSCVEARLGFFSGAFSGRPFQTLYIGGGTPSLLSPRQLRRLLRTLQDRFAFDPAGERTCEMHPVSVSAAKLAVLAEHGFNRVSMGVQSWHTAVLERSRRGYQSRAAVAEAVAAVRRFPELSLNLDLLLGLPGDDAGSFLRSFRGVLDLRPHQVIVYPVRPTGSFLAENHAGREERFTAHLRRAYPGVPEAAHAAARAAGYRCEWVPRLGDLAWRFYAAGPGLSQPRFTAEYDDFDEEPISIFAVGPSARGRIAGRWSYQETIHPCRRFDPEEEVFRGADLSETDEMLKYLVMRGVRGQPPSDSRFRELFGCGVRKAFAKAGSARVTGAGPRERLLSALRFIDLAGMAEILQGSELRLGAGKRTLRLRVEIRRTGTDYLETAGGMGLLVLGELSAVLPSEGYWDCVGSVKAAFRGAVQDDAAGNPAHVAASCRGRLAEALGRRRLDVKVLRAP